SIRPGMRIMLAAWITCALAADRFGPTAEIFVPSIRISPRNRSPMRGSRLMMVPPLRRRRCRGLTGVSRVKRSPLSAANALRVAAMNARALALISVSRRENIVSQSISIPACNAGRIPASRLCREGRVSAGETAEYSIACLSGKRRVIVEEQADDIARRIQAPDRLLQNVQHLRLRTDLDPAKGEGDAAGHGIGPKRRHRNRIGPIGFWNRQTNGLSSIR